MWKTKSSSKLAAASAALLASLITTPPAIVQAQDEATRVDLQAVTVDGSWNNYQLNINTYAYCPITLEENGHLSLRHPSPTRREATVSRQPLPAMMHP